MELEWKYEYIRRNSARGCLVAATIPSGGGGDEPEIPVIHVTSISLNKSSLRLQAGANATLVASISPVNADNKQVTWSSSDTGIATVEDGVVMVPSPVW